MPAATATQKVNKEAVRLLVIQHGQREAARIAGLNEDTVCSWAKRYGWSIASKPQARTGDTQLIAQIADELGEHERKTKLGLATYASKQAKHLSENGKLSDSGHFKNVAGGASIVHRWDAKTDQSQNVVVNVALLGVQPSEVSANVLDVDSESQDSGQ